MVFGCGRGCLYVKLKKIDSQLPLGVKSKGSYAKLIESEGDCLALREGLEIENNEI
jgi:hypothetical protein